MTERVRGLALARRLSTGVADQVVSSGSNFAATLLAARALDRDGFGSYSLAVVLYILGLGISRSLCSEALLIRPGDDDAARRRHARQALGSTVWVAVLAALVLAIGAVAVGGDLRGSLLVLALVLPGLLVQDALRYLSFSRDQPSHALWSDLVWAVGVGVSFGFLILTDSASAERMLAAWGLAGGLAGGAHLVAIRVRPAVRHGLGWVREHRDLSVPYALDFVGGQGAATLSSLALAAVAGVAAAGSVRGALTLFGPVNILFSGAYVILVPEGRRAAGRSARALTRICLVASAALASVAAAIAVVLSFLPDRFGEALLGDTWLGTRDIVALIGVAIIGSGAASGALTGLRTLGQAGAVLRTRVLTMPTTVGLPLLGAVLDDARGLAIGLIAAIWIGVVAYWRAYLRSAAAGAGTPPDDLTDVTEAGIAALP